MRKSYVFFFYLFFYLLFDKGAFVVKKINDFLLLNSSIKNSNTYKESFKVYDALLFKNKPDLYEIGLSKINMIYDDSIMIYENSNLNSAKVSNSKLDKIIKKLSPKYPICVDVETWSFEKEYFNESVKKYSMLLSIIKNKHNYAEIGYYGQFPYADLNLYISDFNLYGRRNNSNWIEEWLRINNNLQPIINKSNVAFPSCYTRTQNKEMWFAIFKKQIGYIKKISPKIKIYPFIWPQYYSPGSSFDQKYLDEEMWRFQLETIYQYCDGVVLWSPHIYLKDRKNNNWSPKESWWLATREFIKIKNIKSNYNAN